MFLSTDHSLHTQARIEDDSGAVVRFSPNPDDDGYVSANFDFLGAESDEDSHEPASKRVRSSKGQNPANDSQKRLRGSLEEDEELALRLLGQT